jgi:hypothetical protein
MKTIRKLMRIGLGMLVVVVLLASIPRTIRVPLKDGGEVSFPQPSLIGKFFSSSSTITFRPKQGKINSMDLEEDVFEGPAMVLSSTNTNVFFCIYDHDTDWLMIKIDLSQEFQPLSPQNPMHSHVLRSTCKIERVRRVDTNDWYFAAAALEKMPSKQFKDQSAGLDLLVYRLRNNQKDLAASMRNNCDSGQYEDDDPIPMHYRHE